VRVATRCKRYEHRVRAFRFIIILTEVFYGVEARAQPPQLVREVVDSGVLGGALRCELVALPASHHGRRKGRGGIVGRGARGRLRLRVGVVVVGVVVFVGGVVRSVVGFQRWRRGGVLRVSHDVLSLLPLLLLLLLPLLLLLSLLPLLLLLLLPLLLLLLLLPLLLLLLLLPLLLLLLLLLLLPLLLLLLLLPLLLLLLLLLLRRVVAGATRYQ
jgi:hypothetical protein